MSEYKGIDVSSYQGFPDWQKFNLDFAILRITERYGTDSSFEHNYKGCVKYNIPFGVYKFSYAMTIDEIKEEAQRVVNVLHGMEIDLPVFLDLEYGEQRRLTKSKLMSMINEFRNIIENAGYKFGIYCNLDWYNNVIPEDAKKYDLWIASYPLNDNGTIKESLRPRVGIMWQYSSKGHVPGFDGNIDMDVCYKKYWPDSKDTVVIEPVESNAETIRKQAVNWMINLANDDSHGYDQIYRWGERGDYDCSSAVITAYKTAGVPLACTYTGNMKQDMLRNGFADVTGYVNLYNGDGLITGDVLLNEVHHTAMYIGNGQEAEASINEFGGATGGRPGDQTGREILIRPYRNYPWDCVLRYMGDTSAPYRPTLRLYDKGETVRELQRLLNDNGSHLEEDGDFGQLTLAAVKEFQMRHLLEVDGIVGEITWNALDHQVTTVLRTPGVIREQPRKSSKHIKSLNAGDKVRVFELFLNEKDQLWCRMDIGWIIANNLDNPV